MVKLIQQELISTSEEETFLKETLANSDRIIRIVGGSSSYPEEFIVRRIIILLWEIIEIIRATQDSGICSKREFYGYWGTNLDVMGVLDMLNII